ncbi:transglutaminase-like domain-containing protein [Opitutus terrae]|uniref:Transglutaminase domain protein n=1 Tax=Opitutus terrae (strain DSM 11246 / JCM 15787 / PB90-1) TaxID=452637 RepID=B1ZPE5_OPITP|nr:transglutaminase family protein [Opitutus terrae]ACB73550.1 transglutaminase domain protein [Opitutus terrae PB90-1]
MKLPLLLAALTLAPHVRADFPNEATRTYRVQQTVTLSGIPDGAKSVKWWIAIPDDERFQEVLDFAVTSAPGPWRIVTEPDHGNRFMLVEVAHPAASSLSSKVEFTVRRRPVFVDLVPAQAGAITDTHRRLFVDELRTDAPHMKVTPRIAKLANDSCGAETNIAKQAQLLLTAVADYADHYSKDPTKPKCSLGDAEDCMTNAGGCCTDLHSMFIALARARGIPARLQMGYRLREANEGKETDPGYRCWAEYFVPNYGWIPADIVEADDPKGLGRARWFTGLTERRLWLNEGREFDLAGRAVTAKRVNTMVIGYAEIDGVEARVIPDGDLPAQLSRTVFYTEQKPAGAVAAR